jgi:hypothetical protein
MRLKTGHSSFLVDPERVVEIIVEAAGGGDTSPIAFPTPQIS